MLGTRGNEGTLQHIKGLHKHTRETMNRKSIPQSNTHTKQTNKTQKLILHQGIVSKALQPSEQEDGCCRWLMTESTGPGKKALEPSTNESTHQSTHQSTKQLHSFPSPKQKENRFSWAPLGERISLPNCDTIKLWVHMADPRLLHFTVPMCMYTHTDTHTPYTHKTTLIHAVAENPTTAPCSRTVFPLDSSPSF